MNIFNILKAIIIVSFFVLLAGKYFDLFTNFKITESLSLFDVRHILVGIYIVVRIIEYFVTKKR